MRIKLIQLGKTEEKYLIEGIQQYVERLKHYTSFEMLTIPTLKATSNLSVGEIKKKEGEILLEKFKNEVVVLLDEQGKQVSSEQFAKFIDKKIQSNVQTLTFVIGGVYGFSEEVYERANEKISLSAMTFSHQMVRLFFLEQLYRGFTILKGEKYHHS